MAVVAVCVIGKDEAAVAITAIGIALFIDLQIDARVAKGRCAVPRAAANLFSPVAPYAGAGHHGRFWRGVGKSNRGGVCGHVYSLEHKNYCIPL